MRTWMKRASATVAAPLTAAIVLTGCSSDGGDAAGNAAQDSDESVTIHLTRHGKTWLNELDRVQGWADSPLTSEGKDVAVRLGEGLDDAGMQMDAAYSADMVRHRETAAAILDTMGEDIPVTENADLREMSFGGFEGDFNEAMYKAVFELEGVESLEEMQEKNDGEFPAVALAEQLAEVNPDPALPAETPEEVSDRALGALEEIATEEGENGNDDVLVVSSGLTILFVLDALGYPVEEEIENASVTTLVYEDGEWTVEGPNDTSLAAD